MRVMAVASRLARHLAVASGMELRKPRQSGGGSEPPRAAASFDVSEVVASPAMTTTMMDVPLTLDWIADRAERWMGGVEVVSRRPDRSITRTTYGEVIGRAR